MSMIDPIDPPPTPPAGDPPSDPPTPPTGDPPSDPPPADPPAPFYAEAPDTWRVDFVKSLGLEEGSDEYTKRMNQIERVSDVPALFKSWAGAQDKIREGFKSEALPDDATPEQIAEYRENNGIPATVEDYKLSDGLVLSEADDRIIAPVLAMAHDLNLPNDKMAALIDTWLEGRADEEHQIKQQDALHQQKTTVALKELWGGDYTRNLNLVKNWVGSLPESVRDLFSSATMSDGTLVFNSPEMMQAFVGAQMAIDPAGSILPNVANAAAGVDARIAEIEGLIGTDEYTKAVEAEYLELLTAKEKMGEL